MSKKGVIIGTGIAVAGIAAGVAVSHVITKGLVKFAIERDMPKSLKKQRPKITQGDRARKFQERIDETGKELLAKEIEEVAIESRDGLRLIGHWYPCENAKRVIVPGTIHRQSYDVEQEKYEAATMNFWKKYA